MARDAKGQAGSQSSIVVCGDTGCTVCGSRELVPVIEKVLQERGLAKKVELKIAGCLGFCENGPLVLVFPGAVFYQQVQAEDAEEIVEKTVLQGEIIERLLYTDSADGRKITCAYDIPFYKLQKRVLLETGCILIRSISMIILPMAVMPPLLKSWGDDPEGVIAEMKSRFARKRGQASTGLKWEFCRASAGDESISFVTPMRETRRFDRSLLEGNPHAVLRA